jgi:spermidine synthase
MENNKFSFQFFNKNFDLFNFLLRTKYFGMENINTNEKLYVEKLNDKFYQVSSIEKVYLQNYETKYQKMDIYELGSFGKALILDNLIQSALNDEYIYHESLVHPAMVYI